ncbi:18689_t:CDS:1, partial [Gigaspora rosea]
MSEASVNKIKELTLGSRPPIYSGVLDIGNDDAVAIYQIGSKCLFNFIEPRHRVLVSSRKIR